MAQDAKEKSYRDTLNLPKTDFPIRAQFAEYDPQVLQRWSDEKLSQKTFEHNKGKETFILHDGPPYANGDIHLGHAFNKILKDIFAKSERMSGKHVPIIPGWDCHGLPIELKVTEQQPGLDRKELKKACRSYAQKWVDIQTDSFKNLGVQMHWDKPYTTMDYSYEAKIVEAFADFYQQGYVKRQLKTVPWCPSCTTVLAHAEIEYEERKDPSIYVQFPLDDSLVANLFPEVAGQEVSLLIWTTTPWTLPLNRAVVLKPGAEYQLVKMKNKLVILGKALVDKVATIADTTSEVITTFTAEKLLGQKVNHPFVGTLSVPIIGDGFTSLEDGTACVHSAPGCGPEDYEIGVKNKLEIYSPISEDGKYTEEINPAELAGMPVADGQIWVIKKLAELDRIFFKQSLRHSYPHCWRCHGGLIFRATSQWFCDLSKNNLKEHALEKIESLQMYPERGKNRFKATLEGRLEWCLSRQRTWGVPIPAVRCVACNHVQTNVELIKTAAQGIAKSGIEFWDEVSMQDLGNFACDECQETSFEKEYDILDVWFESGVSHYAVLNNNPDQSYPADMYLEGKDQHRAWFQSSLLTSLVLEQEASMKSIVTHGFTVDEKGRKMSKSLGNTVLPQDIVDKIGLDGLRLWVASCDYDSDPVYSDVLIKNVSEVYRKVRNTCRFLLSNLYDFDVNKDAVPINDMLAIDQYALVSLHRFNESLKYAYSSRKTTSVFHEVADYCVKDLSSFYLDIVKDRLYVEQADGHLRRSAQTACYYILDTLTKIVAPVFSCMSELVSDHYQLDKQSSIHLQDFNNIAPLVQRVLDVYSSDSSYVKLKLGSFVTSFDGHEYFNIWNCLGLIRSAVLKQLEVLRSGDVVRHSLDAQVVLCITDSFEGFGSLKLLFSLMQIQTVEQFLKEYFIVSKVFLVDTKQGDMKELAPGLFAYIDKAQGEKCTRCWQWYEQDSQDQLCPRCKAVLDS